MQTNFHFQSHRQQHLSFHRNQITRRLTDLNHPQASYTTIASYTATVASYHSAPTSEHTQQPHKQVVSPPCTQTFHHCRLCRMILQT